MIRVPKSILSFGAVGLVTTVVMLAVPRAAHAVAAALVQVNNTAANPALTQDVTLQSAQIVHLGTQGAVLPNFSSVIGVYSTSGSFTNGYSTPANATLVITGIDITPLSSPSQTCPAATQMSLATGSAFLKVHHALRVSVGHRDCARLRTSGRQRKFQRMRGNHRSARVFDFQLAG
jgi:hypothetical protein